MSARYRRREPEAQNDLGALAVAMLAGLGAASVAFYLTRLFLARDRLSGDG